MRMYFSYICMACALLLAACQQEVSDFTLDPAAMQMKVGEMATIDLVGTAQNVEWTSSNEEVATVYHGVVTANAIGAATITATAGSTSKTCEVFVSGTDGATLRITPALVSMKKGETFAFQSGNAYELPLTWTSSDETIATVDENGVVTAVKGGNAIITLSTNIETVTALVAVEHTWGEYQLVWSDEFDGNDWDRNVWTAEVNGNGGGNQEKQYYTDRAENLRVEDGNLVIEVRKEPYESKDYTSARIISKGKKEFLYGKMEARIALPTGKGMWPAFWMLGSRGGWPNCGEIDIMEYVGKQPGVIHGTLHTVKDRDGNKSSRNTAIAHEEDFHVYGIEWTKEEKGGKDVIRFYVDDKVYSEQVESVVDDKDYWPFNHSHYFIINCAIGGTWGGDIDDAIFATPRLMKVDWVRVYQREEIE